MIRCTQSILFLALFLHKIFALIITKSNTLSFRYFVQGYDAKDRNSLSPGAEVGEKRDTALTDLTNRLLFRQITILCLGLALCIPLNSLLSWLTIARVSATSNR
jgi:hypothetical protein